MPIYEYLCQNCSHEFELLLLRNEKPKCPRCGSVELKKLISSFVGRSRWEFDMKSCKRRLPECAPDLCRAGICPTEAPDTK